LLNFILEFIRNDPKLVLMIFALLVTTFSASLAVAIKKINANNRGLDKLEADSLYQISENLKNIERILSATKVRVVGKTENISLREVMDAYPDIPDMAAAEQDLDRLSRHFSDFCGNINKYSDNIIQRKGFCMRFQEFGNIARRILAIFKKCGYENISLGLQNYIWNNQVSLAKAHNNRLLADVQTYAVFVASLRYTLSQNPLRFARW